MKRLLFIVVLLFPLKGWSEVPEGFENLYEEELASISIQLDSGAIFVSEGYLSIGTARFPASAKTEIARFMVNNYVSREEATKIAEQLTQGVEDSLLCIGRRNTCQVESLVESQYVVVQESQVLRILVPASKMSRTEQEQRYISEERGDNALIMHHRLSLNESSQNTFNGYYQNQMTLGFGNSYLKADMVASSDDENVRESNLYFDEVAGYYQSENHKYKVGFSNENATRTWNTTSFLDTSEDLSVIEASFGSSRDLVFKSDAQSPRVYFSISQPGRLVVSREDGTPVLEKNVTSGQHYVPYSELPSGINTLNFKVSAGDLVLYQELHKVYNIAGDNLEPGEWDYHLAAGVIHDQTVIYNATYADLVDEFQDQVFVESRVSTQLSDNMQFGVGLLNTDDEYFSKFGVRYQPLNDFAISLLYGNFDDGSHYFQADTNLMGLTLNASYYSEGSQVSNQMSLSNYLMGYGSSQDITVGYSQNIGRGRAYTSYMSMSRENINSILSGSDLFTDYESLTVGYNFGAWLNSTVDINLVYSGEKSYYRKDTDELTLGLSISLPLGRESYTSYNTSIDEDQQFHRVAAGRNFELSENGYANLEVGATYDQANDTSSDTSWDASASLGYTNSYVRADGFIYGDEESVNVSATLNSTTVLGANQIYQTADRAESYLVIENETDGSRPGIDESESDFYTVANVLENGDRADRLILDRDNIVEALDIYKEYSVTLDDASSDFHNIGDDFISQSSFPGTLLHMGVDMRHVRSYISIFNDIEGNAIDIVECSGAGCIDVEELAEGVFKFRVNSRMPFRLVANDQRCLIPSPDTFSVQNLGENFCMPQLEETGGLELTSGKDGKYYYYIGEFSDDEVIEKYRNLLDEQPISFISKQVGERTFLFIESPELIAGVTHDTILELTQFVQAESSLDVPNFVSN
ncbi:CS1-pili formation C-terminal domain-containing protein [Vibrio paucivorans]|uniref:CS1-pili formation C-terminal domain-containing protein n=1 Tax=Vibrio paucivorans TaxID=2829489 RepID=A0A9X3HT88_9VIBR|nr:CS1-pili formation C-terminal domain-containing protein [Vibrio paucivorans]MCW8335441.1 CS1-pili formation C-terminal domain-containing protein [Vibrio paucivorans]